MAREKQRVAQIKKYLKSLGAEIYKTRGDAFHKGDPDMLVCVPMTLGSEGKTISVGLFVALEAKNDTGGATLLQKAKLRRWRKAGAVARVVRSASEVESLIKSHMELINDAITSACPGGDRDTDQGAPECTEDTDR